MTFNPLTLFRKLATWFTQGISEKVRIAIMVFLLLFVIVILYTAYKINDYFENNPKACFACHVHDEANKVWAKTEHAGINCHECHHSSKKDQMIQMYRFAFLGQRTVSARHGEVIVPRRLCLGCHWENSAEYPKAPDISKSPYHAKHVFIEKIECTKCHGYKTHRFTMEERYCLSCHPNKDFSQHGSSGKPDRAPMGNLPCLNCHTDRTADLLPGRKKCLFCHGDEKVRKELISDGTIDVKHFVPTEETIRKSQKIFVPDNAAMQFSCNTCHNPHVKARPDWSNCTTKCHQNIEYVGKHKSHIEVMGMKCKQCHKPHIWKVTPEQAKKDCTPCHDYKDPKKFLGGV